MEGHDPVVVALHSAIADHGRLLLANPTRLRAVLSDVLGADISRHRADVDAVVVVASSRAGQLMANGAAPGHPAVTDQLAEIALSPEVALRAATIIAAALPASAGTVPVGQSSMLPTSPVPAPTAMGRGAAGDGPTGRPDGGAAPRGEQTSMRPTSGPPPRRRTATILGTVAAVVVAAGLGVGATLLATGGTSEAGDGAAVPPTVVSTVTPRPSVTTEAGATTSVKMTLTSTKVSQVKKTVTVASTAKETVRLVAGDDQAMVDKVCKPMSSVREEIRKSQSTWAGGTNSRQLAQQVEKEFTAHLADLDRIVAAAPVTATPVPTLVMRLREELVAVRAAVRSGGTDSYSTNAWNAAMIEFSRVEEGVNNACSAADGLLAFGTDTATAAALCKAVLPAVGTAQSSLDAWVADPTAANGKALKTRMDAVSTAIATAQYSHPLLYSHPVRMALHDLGWWGYNLGARGASGGDPLDQWVTGWKKARTALDGRC